MDEKHALIPATDLRTMGEIANQIAANYALNDYHQKLAQETLRRQEADIALFEQYLRSAGAPTSNLFHDIKQWHGLTWGLVRGFILWMEERGYATGSINVRLATIKAYCRVAAQSGEIDGHNLALIQSVKGYRSRQARNVDENRRKKGLRTRRPESKKSEPVKLTPKQASLLKQQPDTSQGRRDALLLSILLDLGLRCEEVARLKVGHVLFQPQPKVGTLTFYRHKVDKTQTMALTVDIHRAGERYLETLPPKVRDNAHSPLFYGVARNKPDYARQISVRTINRRVGILGRNVGVEGLSPHDCRHALITYLLKSGVNIKTIQEIGGWVSPEMVLRYATEAEIVNQDVALPEGWSAFYE